MAQGVIELTDDNFQTEVLDSDIPVLVDFWAVWCGPCKRVAPIVEELAVDNAGKMKVAKLDVDAAGGSASEYGVMSIPTLILFKGGQEQERIVGAMPKGQIQSMVNRYL